MFLKPDNKKKLESSAKIHFQTKSGICEIESARALKLFAAISPPLIPPPDAGEGRVGGGIKAAYFLSFLFLFIADSESVYAQGVADSSSAVSGSAAGEQSRPLSEHSTSQISMDSLPGMKNTGSDDLVLDSYKEGPWEAGEIAVQGNINVKASAVLRVVKAKKGRLYHKENIDKDIQAVLGLGSMERATVDIHDLADKPADEKFSGISISTMQAKIVYLVKERPQIKKIVLSGQKQLSKSAILDVMTLKTKDHLDEAKLSEDAAKVSDKYHEKGFIDARVEAKTEIDEKTNTCSITLDISEGKKAKIKTVSLTGVSVFPEKKLVKKFKNRPKKIYLPSELPNDFSALEAFYKNNGYQDFEIERSTVSFNEDKSEVYVSLWVKEGPKYYCGQTSFAGNTVYGDSELMLLLEYKRGQIYSQEKFDDTVRALQDKYADKGYIKAVIKPEKSYNASAAQMDVQFRIAENTVVYVDHVDVEGNTATKTHVLKREVVIKEGSVFSSSKIRKSYEKLMNLRFLDAVDVSVNPTSDPDKVDVGFDIVEGKPGMFTAGAGISSLDGLVGQMSLNHMNLFGRAQQASLSWQFGARVNDYSISWTTPWIKNSPTSLGADLFNTRRLRPFGSATTAYNEKRAGGRIRLGPRFEDDKYQVNISYTYEKINIYNVEDAFLGSLSEGTSVTSSISLEFARDTRDNFWDPTRGCRTSLGFSLAGGPLQGDVNFYKPNFSHSYNYKLLSIGEYPLVISFANRFGFIGRFGATGTVPVYERFFLGGPDTIRGYNVTGQIGPGFGGKVYDVFNAELKFPLAREKKRTIVQWAFFLDIGNSWDNFGDINLETGSGVKRLKAGAGFGIRFTTPVFPIRLDWGYGFNHKQGDQKSEIYFTLGNLF